jgi:alkylhydroperoxidase family enzyme
LPRLHPPKWEEDPALVELVRKISGQRLRVGELYQTLLNSPVIAEGWLHMGTAARQATADKVAIRELIFCYVGKLNGAEHEYQSHEPQALRAGVTEAQIANLMTWESSDVFDDKQRAVLAYTRAMTRDIAVQDDVYAAVKRHFSDKEIVDVTATIGFLNMVSRFLVALRID